MQLGLYFFPFPSGSWAREARWGTDVVIWISDPYQAAQHCLIRQLLEAGAKSQGTEQLDQGVAACLRCPAWLRSALLMQLPKPPSRGSRTPGNYLPW